MKKIILASQSPRRIELLSQLEIPFEVIPADINECIDSSKEIEEEIKRLAKEKALTIFNQHSDSLVIGSDTVVVINNKVLGKPKNREDAFHMLHLLQNNTHQVITGVCLVDDTKLDCFANVTEVTFYPMSDEDIHDYIATKEPMDKAGAYAIQGKAMRFIKKINGDYYSVMGLPVSQIAQHLQYFD